MDAFVQSGNNIGCVEAFTDIAIDANNFYDLTFIVANIRYIGFNRIACAVFSVQLHLIFYSRTGDIGSGYFLCNFSTDHILNTDGGLTGHWQNGTLHHFFFRREATNIFYRRADIIEVKVFVTAPEYVGGMFDNMAEVYFL